LLWRTRFVQIISRAPPAYVIKAVRLSGAKSGRIMPLFERHPRLGRTLDDKSPLVIGDSFNPTNMAQLPLGVKDPASEPNLTSDYASQCDDDDLIGHLRAEFLIPTKADLKCKTLADSCRQIRPLCDCEGQSLIVETLLSAARRCYRRNFYLPVW